MAPRMFSASEESWHPTETPSVTVIGRAKHFIPGMVHASSVNAPLGPHLASWPSMQAAWEPVQAELGVRVLKTSLYCWAWARLLA